MPKTPPPRIVVRLAEPVHPHAAVDFYEFGDFCDAVAACLRRAESIATGSSGRIRFKVVGLEVGSATVEIEAERPPTGRDDRAKTVRLFRNTIKNIESGRKPDHRLGRDDIQVFRKLANPLERGQAPATGSPPECR